jgi:hypothetical protein
MSLLSSTKCPMGGVYIDKDGKSGRKYFVV